MDIQVIYAHNTITQHTNQQYRPWRMMRRRRFLRVIASMIPIRGVCLQWYALSTLLLVLLALLLMTMISFFCHIPQDMDIRTDAAHHQDHG